ncbi:MAG: hypothetical protein ACR2MB_07515 [Acidimicrobiales bacterium]
MESGQQNPGPPAGPGGLTLLVRADPVQAAHDLATEVGAELAVGGPQIDAAIDRLEADERGSGDLDQLTAAMRRAEKVLAQTRNAASIRLSATLNTRLAIHPDTIRRTAEDLLAARRALERALLSIRRRRQWAAWGLVALAGLTTAAGGLVAVGWSPVIGAGIAVTAGLAVISVLRRHRRSTPDTPSAGLVAAVEIAERRWVQIGGVGADPVDVEAMIHRYDPQHQVVANLVGEHPAVRAAEQVVLTRRLAWVRAWRQAVATSSEPGPGPAVRRPTELWLTSPEPGQVAAADLVVAMPYDGLDDGAARRLHRRLAHLPPGVRVVAIVGPGADTPLAPEALDLERRRASIAASAS